MRALFGSPLPRNVDLRFWFWKRHHPGGSFAEFYAAIIAAKLGRGGVHKTLVSRNRLSGRVPRVDLDLPERRSRDLNYFQLAKEQGLRPEHTCIDFGCGSLRVGRHLIDYLEPRRYLGLDVVSDFYEAGRALLPPALLAEKQPDLRVLDDHSILAARQLESDFVVSFAVLKHVPPVELDAYFANLTALMAPRTKALITFTEAGRTSRTGSKIWQQSVEDLTSSIRRQGVRFACAVSARRPGAALPRKSVLTIQKIGAGAS